LPSKLERLGAALSDKMIVISEFGMPGVFAPDAATADAQRVRIIREQLAEFARHDWIGGAIFWCYQDYKSHRNLRPGESSGYVDHGLVDEQRQRRPSYQVWREANEPLRVSVEWNSVYETPTGFTAQIARRGEEELPSYPLRGYRAEWTVWDDDDRLVGEGATVLPLLGPPQTLEGRWAGLNSKGLRLRIRVVPPTGIPALDRAWRWWEPRSGGLTLPQMEREGKPIPE